MTEEKRRGKAAAEKKNKQTKFMYGIAYWWNGIGYVLVFIDPTGKWLYIRFSEYLWGYEDTEDDAVAGIYCWWENTKVKVNYWLLLQDIIMYKLYE